MDLYQAKVLNEHSITLDGPLTGTFYLRSSGTFLGSSNTEARFDDTKKLLSFDLNGDSSSDMEIVLDGVGLTDLDANDFAFV